MGLLFLLLASIVAMIAIPASACSVTRGYRIPTNLELAERADTIVIGMVDRFEEGESALNSFVLVKPTILLKGTALPDTVRMTGFSSQRMRELMRRTVSEGEPEPAVHTVTRSDPRELRQPNPDALIGGCVRYLFDAGMKLVVFLKHGKAGAVQFMMMPFARVSEDVPSDDALWVKAVRLYVEIAALPPGKRKAAMIARRDALRALGDADSLLLARDIDVELSPDRR